MSAIGIILNRIFTFNLHSIQCITIWCDNMWTMCGCTCWSGSTVFTKAKVYIFSYTDLNTSLTPDIFDTGFQSCVSLVVDQTLVLSLLFVTLKLLSMGVTNVLNRYSAESKLSSSQFVDTFSASYLETGGRWFDHRSGHTKDSYNIHWKME